MISAMGNISDETLLAEQLDFYRADAEPFDRWLGELISPDNTKLVASTYRAGLARIADAFRDRAPLGRVLEIAAGPGRLAEVYLPYADSIVLLDASAESLAIAATRLAPDDSGHVSFVEADVFTWDGDGRPFDTIVFSAWLHHVPHALFDGFWQRIDTLLGPTGRVIFDFPDANIEPPGNTGIPSEPAQGYGFYAPVDGISIRDHFGRRWRVVHNLWAPADLADRLGRLGWKMTAIGPGLFGNIVWAEAVR
jgi:SAM-dependent methyltransferase